MSQDNVTYLLNKHAAAARATCPEIPQHVHAHQLRHARAMQMLRAGVPLPHIKEFLGHANIATTSIYASELSGISSDGRVSAGHLVGWVRQGSGDRESTRGLTCGA